MAKYDTKEIQTLLNNHGYNLAVDGIIGPKTRNAIEDFQKKNGLYVDGIVGNNTYGALTKSKSGTATSTPKATTTPASFTYAPSTATKNAQAQNQADVDALRNYGTFTPEQWGGSTQANQWWDKSLNMEKPVWDGAQYDQSVIDAANAIRNREKFSYDLNGDALYQQYKDKYIQQGKLAMMDTMGQAAALTGGYGSSYAATVGNQAYQAQLQNLNDIVPELYQLAYDRYQQEGQDLKDAYSLVKDWRDTKYGEWRDSMGDYYDESNMYWNRGTDIYNREYGEFTDRQNLNYKEWQSGYDKIADLAGLSTDAYNNERTFDYGSQQDVYNSKVDSQERAKSDVYAAIQSGVMPSDSMLQAAGLYDSKTQLQAMAKSYEKQVDATVASKTKSTDDTGSYDPIDDDKPVGEPVVTPSETKNTTNFINSHIGKDEFMRRGKSYKDFIAYIEAELSKADLEAGEYAYLEDYYGL